MELQFEFIPLNQKLILIIPFSNAIFQNQSEEPKNWPDSPQFDF